MNEILVTNVVDAARYVFKCRDELCGGALDRLEAAVKALEKSLAPKPQPKANGQPAPKLKKRGKMDEHRDRAEAYIRKHGPQSAYRLCIECGIPEGSITPVIREARFTRDKDNLVCLSGKAVEAKQPKPRGRKKARVPHVFDTVHHDSSEGPTAVARGRSVIAAELLALDRPVSVRTLARQVNYSEKFVNECLVGDSRFKATDGGWVLR